MKGTALVVFADARRIADVCVGIHFQRRGFFHGGRSLVTAFLALRLSAGTEAVEVTHGRRVMVTVVTMSRIGIHELIQSFALRFLDTQRMVFISPLFVSQFDQHAQNYLIQTDMVFLSGPSGSFFRFRERSNNFC